MSIFNSSIKVVSVYGEQLNRNFDDEKDRSYANYWKTSGIALLELPNGTLVTVKLDNTSFGNRRQRSHYEVSIDRFRWIWNMSNIDGDVSTPNEKFLDILESIEGILKFDPDEIVYGARHAIGIAAIENWSQRI